MECEFFRRRLRSNPFQAFRLLMVNGETHEVRDPRGAFVMKSRLVVGTDFDAEGTPAGFSTCEYEQIETIELIKEG